MDRNRSQDTPAQTTDVVTDRTLDATRDERPETPLQPAARDDQAIPMKTSEMKGKAVLSITTGLRLGRVEEALLNPASLDLSALRISADDQQAVVPFAQVRSIGRDAVMVEGDDVAQWITTSIAAEGLVTFDDLKHHKVVDDAGTLLGTPRAIAVEPQSGRLQQLEVHSGGMLGMGGQTTTVPGSDVTGVGADVIVVRAGPRPA
jgi:sporulation protein YlmC with PRC-barrel domain